MPIAAESWANACCAVVGFKVRRALLLIACIGLAAPVPLDAQRIETELICAWQGASAPLRTVWTDGQVSQLSGSHTLLRFRDVTAARRAYEHLRFHPERVTVQYNYTVQPRAQPNDPDYVRQDNFARQGFEEAWDLTTGGALPNGIPIVTAVLDAGFDADHEDLYPNLWINPGELAGDQLDNDGNGYVDDVHGFNFIDSLGEYNSDAHGTQVAGLLGAVGNNGVGVSGTNWDARLMLFSIRTVADIIQAYDYIIAQRRQFNSSGGTRGALIVATNASFGVEGASCTDFPVWGAMYDRLGEVGILTAASVVNAPVNVDESGDMPTDCPSDYLLSVTNVDTDDALHPEVGYGSVSVDLAAAGQGSYSTRPGDRYGPFGSSSAAAPYVTGAISLLYAGACPTMIRYILDRPAEAARLVRGALLDGVAPRTALSGVTVTGGMLDVHAAQTVLDTRCPEVDDIPLRVTSVWPNPTQRFITVQTSLLALSDELDVTVYDALGRLVARPVPSVVFNGTAGIRLDLRGLPTGYYTVKIRNRAQYAQAAVVVH
ncbi:hypothetical protein LEM8419_01470 [Neolewinella maritima]|uniref:T9SS type A sorting domain-containing protein n=1 Tax=Neolewinella maritima TaxID=1383882 RepID=A0ABN8F1T9_9BACT|nr:hypothetical protein LEM8419_01470 [Neolewinella maritima]